MEETISNEKKLFPLNNDCNEDNKQIPKLLSRKVATDEKQ